MEKRNGIVLRKGYWYIAGLMILWQQYHVTNTWMKYIINEW